MRLSRIQNLIISGCIALLSVSCAVQTVKGFEKAEKTADNYRSAYFSDLATDYVYKANISVYGREFGGIVIAKKINDSIHRVAFTTEFGNKLFDFEIGETEFKVNYILEELDRKILVNTLKDDFRLVLKELHQVNEQYQDEEFIIYKSKHGKRYNYLFTDRESGALVKLVHTTRSKEKISISYTPKSNTLAQNIIIDHKNIKLQIELNYIN